MECPICSREMIEGKIQLYEMGSPFFHLPATMKFIPNDKKKKAIKTVKGGYYTNNQGYCCEKCKKIVAIVPYENWF